ncbi:hypothetical protein RIE95_09595 [Acidithiobacillus thiooxidans]|uniref:hypothetical protein n=1 Tax=Acidithiobacillus thiooxidans TaxID=930 RepID=UPI0028674BE3|nr:hypothetical protein [Acidithiobacillus thiooxidans]MDR7927231.1 hypothetical protein [Acidithiobacillus thiooxidans]
MFSETEILAIQREWQAAADQGDWDWDVLIAQDWVRKYCPPGVAPDHWAAFLEELDQMDTEDMDDTEIQEMMPKPGSYKDWQERMQDRMNTLYNQIEAMNMSDEICHLEVEAEKDPENHEKQQALLKAQQPMNHLKAHLWRYRQLEEPENLNRDREMWMLECLIYQMGSEEELEQALQTLEKAEMETQDIAMPDPEDLENLL